MQLKTKKHLQFTKIFIGIDEIFPKNKSLHKIRWNLKEKSKIKISKVTNSRRTNRRQYNTSYKNIS